MLPPQLTPQHMRHAEAARESLSALHWNMLHEQKAAVEAAQDAIGGGEGIPATPPQGKAGRRGVLSLTESHHNLVHVETAARERANNLAPPRAASMLVPPTSSGGAVDVDALEIRQTLQLLQHEIKAMELNLATQQQQEEGEQSETSTEDSSIRVEADRENMPPLTGRVATA